MTVETNDTLNSRKYKLFKCFTSSIFRHIFVHRLVPHERGLPENARGGLGVMSANGTYERDPASLLAG